MADIVEVYRFSDPRMILYCDENGFLGFFMDDDTGCKVKLDIPQQSERNLTDTIQNLDTQGLLEFTYPEQGLLLIKSKQTKPKRCVKKEELLVIETEELICRIYLIDERVEAVLQIGEEMDVLPVVIMFPYRVETLKVVLQEKYRMKMIDGNIEDGKVIISEKPPIQATVAKEAEHSLEQFAHGQITEYKTMTTDLVEGLKTSLKTTTGRVTIKRVRPTITYSADREVVRVQTGSYTVKSDSMQVERQKANEDYELEVLKQDCALKSVEKVHSGEERKEKAGLEQVRLTEKSRLGEQYARQELQARNDLEVAKIKYSEKLRMVKRHLESVHQEAERHAKLEAARMVNEQQMQKAQASPRKQEMKMAADSFGADINRRVLRAKSQMQLIVSECDQDNRRAREAVSQAEKLRNRLQQEAWELERRENEHRAELAAQQAAQDAALEAARRENEERRNRQLQQAPKGGICSLL